MVCLMAEPYHRSRLPNIGVTVKQAPVLPRKDILEALLKMLADGSLRVSDRANAAAHRISAARTKCRRPAAPAARWCSRLRKADGTIAA